MFPYQFFLDQLYPLEFRHKRMFGVDAFYYEDKIMFALFQKEEHPNDNGIWIATKKQHHQKLKHKFSSIKHIEYLSIKNWLMLPESSEHFESEVHKLQQLIRDCSELVGNIPAPKKRKL